MTKFADQLFDDLMREHGASLTPTKRPAPARRLTARPVLVTASAVGLAVAATAGALLAQGGRAPAFAATQHANGTVTLAVYDKSGYAGINAALRKLGDNQVFVVPVEDGCATSWFSLPKPPQQQRLIFSKQTVDPKTGAITVQADDIPKGDIFVVAIETSTDGNQATMTKAASKLTAAPAPSCLAPFKTRTVSSGGRTWIRYVVSPSPSPSG